MVSMNLFTAPARGRASKQHWRHCLIGSNAQNWRNVPVLDIAIREKLVPGALFHNSFFCFCVLWCVAILKGYLYGSPEFKRIVGSLMPGIVLAQWESPSSGGLHRRCMRALSRRLWQDPRALLRGTIL